MDVKPDYGPERPGGGLWREQHDSLKLEDSDAKKMGAKRVRITTQTALVRYYVRGELSRHEDENKRLYAAGQEYYKTAYKAGLAPRYSSIDMERVVGSGNDPDSRYVAADKLNKANREIGNSYASCLFSICVVDMSAADWAKGRGLKGRSGLCFLVDALRELGTYWRMA